MGRRRAEIFAFSVLSSSSDWLVLSENQLFHNLPACPSFFLSCSFKCLVKSMDSRDSVGFKSCAVVSEIIDFFKPQLPHL